MVTIGPRSASESDLIKFARKTNLFRLNGSHGTLEWHRSAISKIHAYCDDPLIIMDIPGIKPRTANKDKVQIKEGEKITFGSTLKSTKHKLIKLTKPLPRNNIDASNFSINDGQYIFDVTKTERNAITGVSRQTFTLLPKKGINIPESIYDEDQQYTIYCDFIRKISNFPIDALGLSFVQTSGLVEKIRAMSPELILIAKIENSEGLKNCEQIAESSDAIMIDRGDLVAEIGYQRLFPAVEKIADISKKAGKPLIMATENLESMLKRELPTKSEVISLGHSAKIGVDCFMLSEETATSRNKHKIVNWLDTFLKAGGYEYEPKYSNDVSKTNSSELSIWEAVKAYKNHPIIVMSKSGRAISKYLSKFPKSSLHIITNNKKVVKTAKLCANNISIYIHDFEYSSSFDILIECINANKDSIFINTNNALAIYVSKYINTPTADTITLINKFNLK